MSLNKRNVIIIFLIIVVIIVGSILISNIIKNLNSTPDLPEIEGALVDEQGNEIKVTSTQYDTMKEAVEKLKVAFVKQTVSDKKGFVTNLYVKFNRKLTSENETYFNDFIKTMVVYTDYNSFSIIDEENNINIDVYCEKNAIQKIIINGKENYFAGLKNQEASNNYEEYKITKVDVEAEELKQIIEDNWNLEAQRYGAEEGEYFDYKTSIKIKVIDGKVFNIVFKRTYLDDVVSGLKTTSTLEEVNEVLGEATFKDFNTVPPHGYKTKDFYIFFTGQQISIYRIQKSDLTLQNAISNLEKSDGNISKFLEEITSKWEDYDTYEENGNKFEVQYTLRGLKIQNKNAYEPKITIYGNFEGAIKNNKYLSNVDVSNLPSDIQIKNTNSIFELERKRWELETAEEQ